MRRATKHVLILFAGLALAGCGQGLPYHQAKPNFPKLAADKSRVFVYRTGNVLAMMFPRVILMDGKPFGDTFAGTSTYRDVPPGKHTFSFTSGKFSLDVGLRPGTETFLHVTIHVDGEGIGDTIIEVVAKETAANDMHYTNMIEPKVRDLVK